MASGTVRRPNIKKKGGKSKKNVTASQISFVEEVKTNAERELERNSKSSPFLIQPPEILYHGSEKKLDVTKWYQHDVLVCAPHLNYPKVNLPCKCGGSYKPKQWADDRIIIGLNGRVTLLQFRYECDTCDTTKTTAELVKLEECPDIVSFNTQRHYYLTESKIIYYT